MAVGKFVKKNTVRMNSMEGAILSKFGQLKKNKQFWIL
jgi:hypothetical protein